MYNNTYSGRGECIVIRQYNSIIFDLDGTLWNPTDTCVNYWNEALENMTVIKEPTTREALQSIFGMKVDLIGSTLFPYLSEER